MPKINILTMPPEEVPGVLAQRRCERAATLNEDKLIKAKIDRSIRVLRALLKSGDKDGLFDGFNGDEAKWAKKAAHAPDEWVWVRAKYGVIGVPYPDGSSYSFAPGASFPMFKEYVAHVHKTMQGEVREI